MYRIMSFNVLCWGNEEHDISKRKPLCVDVIKEFMPDSFGVQEAHIEWINNFKDNLPLYDYVGVGRDDGKEGGEFSAVFYRKDKFTASEVGNFWISETPSVPSKGWDSACTRIATHVKLTDKENGKSYVHFNTHLDHKGRVAQVNGAKMICDKAAAFGGVPVVCTGDFNVLQGSDCYQTMISGNMADSRFLADDTSDSFTFHGFDPDNIKDIIDFIFVDKNTVNVKKFDVVNKKINGEFYSDHYAVYADINI